jgi:hypothetical protein
MDKVQREMSAILIDWPKNLRDGYDMEKAERGICTTVNMFFYGFMKTMSRLYRVLGEKKKAERAEAIYFYTSEFMGIKPCGVGYSSFLIDPKIPEGAERMEVELPAARGMIKASFEVCGEIKKYTVTAPREIEIKFQKKNIEFTRVYS